MRRLLLASRTPRWRARAGFRHRELGRQGNELVGELSMSTRSKRAREEPEPGPELREILESVDKLTEYAPEEDAVAVDLLESLMERDKRVGRGTDGGGGRSGISSKENDEFGDVWDFEPKIREVEGSVESRAEATEGLGDRGEEKLRVTPKSIVKHHFAGPPPEAAIDTPKVATDQVETTIGQLESEAGLLEATTDQSQTTTNQLKSATHQLDAAIDSSATSTDTPEATTDQPEVQRLRIRRPRFVPKQLKIQYPLTDVPIREADAAPVTPKAPVWRSFRIQYPETDVPIREADAAPVTPKAPEWRVRRLHIDPPDAKDAHAGSERREPTERDVQLHMIRRKRKMAAKKKKKKKGKKPVVTMNKKRAVGEVVIYRVKTVPRVKPGLKIRHVIQQKPGQRVSRVVLREPGQTISRVVLRKPGPKIRRVVQRRRAQKNHVDILRYHNVASDEPLRIRNGTIETGRASPKRMHAVHRPLQNGPLQRYEGPPSPQTPQLPDIPYLSPRPPLPPGGVAYYKPVQTDRDKTLALLKGRPVAATSRPSPQGGVSKYSTVATPPLSSTSLWSESITDTTPISDSSLPLNQDTRHPSPRISPEITISYPTPRQRTTLPLSPLMAPNDNLWSTIHTPKLPPPDNPTPFQLRLRRNPFALALASPTRMCSVTRTLLPRSFLQSFEALPRPDTDELWLLPRDLSARVPRDELAEGETNRRVRIGRQGYALASKELLKAMDVKGSGVTGSWNMLSGLRGKDNARRKFRWRGDMDEFVAGLMRKRIEEEMVALMSMKQGFLDHETGWEQVGRRRQTGAVLWMGPYTKVKRTKFPEWWVHKVPEDDGAAKLSTSEESQSSPSVVGEKGPGRFATFSNPPYLEKKVPLHNVVTLLGQEGVENLRKQVPGIMRHELVVIKDRHETVKVRMMLWKLEAFLANPDRE